MHDFSRVVLDFLTSLCFEVVYLVVTVATHSTAFPHVTIIMLAAVYGLQVSYSQRNIKDSSNIGPRPSYPSSNVSLCL
jgi:hypothetical protein